MTRLPPCPPPGPPPPPPHCPRLKGPVPAPQSRRLPWTAQHRKGDLFPPDSSGACSPHIWPVITWCSPWLSLVHSFIQQIFAKQLLCAEHWRRGTPLWAGQAELCLCEAHSPVGGGGRERRINSVRSDWVGARTETNRGLRQRQWGRALRR